MKDSSLNEDLSVAVPSETRQPRSKPDRCAGFRTFARAPGRSQTLPVPDHAFASESSRRYPSARSALATPSILVECRRSVRRCTSRRLTPNRRASSAGRSISKTRTTERSTERSNACRRDSEIETKRTRNGRRRCTPSEIRRHLQASSGRYRERRDVPDLDRRKRVRYKCAKHLRRRAAAAAFERARRKKTESRAARRFGKGAKNEQNER